MTRLASGTILLSAVVVLAAGCSDAGSGPTTDHQINFNLATSATTAVAASTAATSAPETFTDGTNTLVLDQVDLVLREIELKRAEATAACGEPEGNDACEELELGPVLLSLPLGAGTARAFSVTVAPGTYDEVEFQIHQPSASDDAAFIQANPGFAGVSVHVSGTYNGTPFDFVSDLEAEEEIHLNPALAVTAPGATELTLMVDLDAWFRNAGGSLLDPASAGAGQPNESIVKDNIRRALDAFEDDDHDGRHDDNTRGADDGPNHT
jgi:hypothetical protein